MKKPKPKMMTTETFLKRLAKLKDNRWWVNRSGAIRCERGLCPILALYYARKRVSDPEYDNDDAGGQPAQTLRIPARLAEQIIDAADCDWDKYLRPRIMAALGLA